MTLYKIQKKKIEKSVASRIVSALICVDEAFAASGGGVLGPDELFRVWKGNEKQNRMLNFKQRTFLYSSSCSTGEVSLHVTPLYFERFPFYFSLLIQKAL